MFIERDESKRVIQAKYFLAKPNKTITAPIHEAFDGEVNFIAGGIHELTLSIPYYIEKDFEMVENPNIKNIKERMLIRRMAGTRSDWFLVDSIKESGDSDDVYTITAFSLPYELRDKRMKSFAEESVNAKEAMEKLVAGTAWTVGTVAPKYLNTFRTFEESGDNALDFVLTIDETFNSLLVFDTNTRKINITDPEETSKYRGLAVDYSRLLENVNVDRVSEGLVTRLYVEGSEGLSIASVNPTGQNYIEDFSYFMHPFEQDANGTIIRSSDFMSDALCLAITAQQKLVVQNAGGIKTLTERRAARTVALIDEETALAQLIAEQETIEELLDLAKATGDTLIIAERNRELAAKKTQVSNQRTKVLQIQNEILSIDDQLNALYASIAVQSNFTPQLQEELKLYTLEREWIDDRYIDPKELFEAGLEKFKEMRTPVHTLSIGLVNFLEIVEEEYYWDKLILNDKIKVKHPRMNMNYFSRIAEIQIGEETISLTISNTTKVSDGFDKLGNAIKQSAAATTVLQTSKKKWDQAGTELSKVAQWMNSEYDANKQRILAGVNNLIEIGKRGIIVRSPDFPDEVIVIQSGIMALSQDNGDTWDTAITPRGIIAERLMGRILAGEELIITNSSGSFTMDNNGAVFNVGSFVVRSSTGNINLVDRWQNSSDFLNEYTNDNVITSFEKRMLEIKWKEIKKRYDMNQERITHHFKDDVIRPFIATYNNAYQALYNYLFVELAGPWPLLAPQNLGNSTPVVSSIFKQKFEEYDTALVELEKQFDLNLQERITNVNFVITDEEIIQSVTRTETWKIQMRTLNEGIAEAKQAAANAAQNLSNMMSDLTISPIEKSTIALVWSEIRSQYTQFVALAATIGVSSTALTTAYNRLDGNSPKIQAEILLDMKIAFTLTEASRDLFKMKMDAYFAEVEKLNRALSEKVNSTAVDAKAGLDNLMSDLKITPLEKTELARQWERIKAEYAQLNSQALNIGVNPTTRTNFTNAYNALNGVSPKLQDEILLPLNMNQTYNLTAATRDLFRNKISVYFTAAGEVSKAITDGLKRYVDEMEFGDVNLVPNSSGNLNGSGEEPTYWLPWQSGTDLMAQISDEGGASVLATVTAAGGGVKTPLTTIAGGGTYTLTLEVRADKVATISHQLRFVTELNVESTPVAAQEQASVPIGDWVKFTLTFTAPADAVAVYTTPNLKTATAYPAEIEVRKVQIESGTKASDWSPSTQDIVRQFTLVRTKLSHVEEIVSADSIISTITSSESYKNLMDSKANADDIGNLATKDELGDIVTDINRATQNAIAGIDFTPYVKTSDFIRTAENITSKFRAAGGRNLLLNSVGYADFTSWRTFRTAYIMPIQDDDLSALKFGSGFQFSPTTTAAYIEQDVSVTLGVYHTLAWHLNKDSSTGDVWFEILEEGVVKASSSLGVGVKTEGYENYHLTFIPTVSSVTVRIRSTANAVVTGLMFTLGDQPLQWSTATGEVYNTNIRFDLNGIRVSQLNAQEKEIGFTQMNYDEFAGYFKVLDPVTKVEKFEKIFYLNGQETVSKKLRALEEITMGKIRIVNVDTPNNKGWAFIPLVE